MSESTRLRSNENIKRFTLVDSQGESLTNDSFDSINAIAPKSSTVSAPAQTAQSTTAAIILAANSTRKRLIVQNTGTTIIKLSLGGTNPTATAYHVALQACAAADDGTGGSYIDESWTGVVRAISSAAGGTLVVTELT